MATIKDLKFDDGELQVIERMALAFSSAISKDWDGWEIEAKRTIALISFQEKPEEFIKIIREKAGSYAGRL